MDNTYEITVQATDGATHPNTTENTTSHTVTVTVTNVDETPEITNPPADKPNFPEIEYDFVGTPDLHVATFTARDEEMQDITWDLTGDDAGDFTITENSDEEGVVTFTDPPNFEMLGDTGSDGTYEFTVAATGTGGNTATHDYSVTVTDVNEVPEFTGTPTATVPYDENAATDVADYDARDEEGGVTWSLTGADASDFAIDTGGIVTFANTPSYEDANRLGRATAQTLTATGTCSRSSRRISRAARSRLDRHYRCHRHRRRPGGARQHRGGQPQSCGGHPDQIQIDRPGQRHRHLRRRLSGILLRSTGISNVVCPGETGSRSPTGNWLVR